MMHRSNHKKIIVFIITSLSTICSFGQMEASELQGLWKVKKIIKKSTSPELRGAMDGFEKASFHFLENGDFQLKTESKAPAFQMILRMTQGAKWKFESEHQLIKIGSEQDRYSIMGIYPTQKDFEVTFSLDESEMVLQMEKELLAPF